MILGRNTFFLLLSMFFVVPFYAFNIVWLNNSRHTTGVAWFMGHTLELHGDISRHLVIFFKVGKDTITFEASDNLGFHIRDSVPVLYQKDHPLDARINSPVCIWGDTVVNSLVPIMVLIVLFLTPEKFDPLIPRKAKIRIGIKPFIKIIPYGTDS